MERQNSCVSCNRSVLRRRKHCLNAVFLERYRDLVMLLLQEIIPREISFDGSRYICHPCWQRYDRALQNQQLDNVPPQPIQEIANQEIGEGEVVQQIEVADLQGPGFITVTGYRRVSNTARRCIFLNCRGMTTHRVPIYAKFYLLHNHNLYIPELARVCHFHLVQNDWEELVDAPTRHESFNNTHVLDIINLYKWGLESRSELDFENIETIDDNHFHFWTALTKNQFMTILEQTPSLRNRSDRPATTLGIYLTKIRTSQSDERLATKFQISRRTLERKLQIARECLTEEFVPRYLGLDHITREEVLARNLRVPTHIFGGNQNEPAAILVCDGTYIYLQKSANFLFQRKTYSLVFKQIQTKLQSNKFRNLVKPFLIVCTDGYIIEVAGPYSATTSDATIMRSLMREDSAWHWYLRPNDVFILDRGFRDSIPAIEERGYNPHIPPTRGRGEQLSTHEANKSRLITMCRWVIETINGRFKKDFKIFRHTYFNVAMQNMMTDFRITAAIINASRKPYEDNLYAEQFVEIINQNINRENELAEYVSINSLNRQRVAFVPLDGNSLDFEDFPRLTFEDLNLFTLGSYHLRIARSYVHEHIRPNGDYIIEMYRHQHLINNKILIRGRIQSRHIRMKQYYTYILLNPTRHGRQCIEEYYCSCIHGRRTVGSCAHIASIVYYLSWSRHQEATDAPAAFLNDLMLDLDQSE